MNLARESGSARAENPGWHRVGLKLRLKSPSKAGWAVVGTLNILACVQTQSSVPPRPELCGGRSVHSEIYSIRDTTVYIFGDEAVVTGKVANSRTHQQTLAAQIYVTLYREGRETGKDVVELGRSADGIHTRKMWPFIGSVPGTLSVRAEVLHAAARTAS